MPKNFFLKNYTILWGLYGSCFGFFLAFAWKVLELFPESPTSLFLGISIISLSAPLGLFALSSNILPPLLAIVNWTLIGLILGKMKDSKSKKGIKIIFSLVILSVFCLFLLIMSFIGPE